jgi:hypothetical protein
VGGGVEVAQHNGAQADGLHHARLAVDGDDVAHPHLVFEDEEEAGDDVAHQVLGAKADGEADDAGAGEDGVMLMSSSRRTISPAMPITTVVIIQPGCGRP